MAGRRSATSRALAASAVPLALLALLVTGCGSIGVPVGSAADSAADRAAGAPQASKDPEIPEPRASARSQARRGNGQHGRPPTWSATAAVPTAPAEPGRRTADFSMPDPGTLDRSLRTADVLVTSQRPIPARTAAAVDAVPGVAAAMPLSVAGVSSNGRTLTVAATDDLAELRRFTPVQTAQSDAVWRRVAGGEIAVDPGLGPRVEQPAGFVRLGNHRRSPAVHIGAYAPMVKRIAAVVGWPRGRQLGMVRDNALLVSTGRLTPSEVTGRIERVLGGRATLQVLALEFDVDAVQTAVLTGTSAADAVGSFDYRALPDGRVVPDASWVRAHIRTESVPILGEVTCHRVMLPQLREVMREVVAQGLAPEIDPGEFAGCYYPRFIGNDPVKGLSLHSWGIAVDLNVPGNQRGTVGEMDRGVVAIFKKWGFAWGGDWSYTDPMHFEMDRLVDPR